VRRVRRSESRVETGARTEPAIVLGAAADHNQLATVVLEPGPLLDLEGLKRW
jgi:hypothetical protein